MAIKKRDTRFPIKLPPWHEKRLIYWAYCKATTKTQLAQNTLQARVEANADQIDAMMLELAQDRAMSLSELQKEVLESAKYTQLDKEKEDVEEE